MISVDGFDGPIALLLSLIEARRMDVLTVPLGALAGAYLEAIAALPAERLTNVSAFVAIASQLILIKSRALLPRRVEPAPTGLDEPDPEAELRVRLLLYRAHRDAGRRLVEAAIGPPDVPPRARGRRRLRPRGRPSRAASRRWTRFASGPPSSGRLGSCRRRRRRRRSSPGP